MRAGSGCRSATTVSYRIVSPPRYIITHIDEHVLLAVLWGDEKDESKRDYDDDTAVREEARRQEPSLELGYRRCCRLGRPVERDDGRTEYAQEAAYFAKEGELLFQEDGGENRTGRMECGV